MLACLEPPKAFKSDRNRTLNNARQQVSQSSLGDCSKDWQRGAMKPFDHSWAPGASLGQLLWAGQGLGDVEDHSH